LKSINWLWGSKSGLIVLAIVIFFLSLVAFHLDSSLQSAKSIARTNAMNLALVLESKLNTDFNAADSAVSDIADDIDPAVMHAKVAKRNASKINFWLKSKVQDIASASAMRLFDANGDLLYSNQKGATTFNISDREFFQAMKAKLSSNRTVFSDIALTHSTGHSAMIVAKPIHDRNGQFLGVAVVAIDLAYLANEFSQIELGSQGVVSLRRLDNGELIARYPGLIGDNSKTGANIPVLQAIRKGEPNGYIEITSPVDSVRRIYGYKTIGNFPFFIAVGIADTDYLAAWKKSSAVEMLGVVLFLAILLPIEIKRNRSDQKLHESEQRFRDLVQEQNAILNSRIVGIVKLKDRKFVWTNEAFAEMLGFTKEDMIGQPTRIVYPNDETHSAFGKEAYPVIQRGEVIRTEIQYLHKDGTLRWYEIGGSLLRLENDESIWAFIDITERKKTEDALREREARLRVMLENDQVGIATVKDRKLQWVNPVYEKLLGYEKGELTGVPAKLLYKNELEYLTMFEKYYPVIKAGRVFRTEQEFVRKDGSPITVDLSGSLLNPETGESLWIYLDITDRKVAEYEQRIAATAFESQEGMCISDANGRILRVNRSFTRITGYSTEEVIGKTTNLLKSGRHDKEFYDAMWSRLQREGVWEGEIWNRRKSGEVYPEHLTINEVKNTNGIVTNYVSTLTDITITKNAENEIKHLAFYDPLTRLPNRRLLLDRLRQTLASLPRNGRTAALLFIDLDDFKTLNDTLGHDIGDLLLQQVAKRLESCVREGDTVARLGGDEFVILLQDLSHISLEAGEQTESIGNKILVTLNLPYQLATHEYSNTPSIGATLFNDNSQSVDELMKQADIAMYQSKKAGRNRLHFFDPKMQEIINARVIIERELRSALGKMEFQLFYQIQMREAEEDGLFRTCGAEVLIRWNHPERGFVSPADFIPLAEETGDILAIGQWVLEEACRQLMKWQTNELTRNLVLAINVSAKQFRQANFVSQVQAVLQRYKINPKLIKLELTESLLLDDIEDTIATMTALNRIGIKFSLDDFGTGYSSLQYLKRLPLDQLKIDQSFVRDIASDSSDKAIVRTIIVMAQSLNLNVIAEGVETKEQLTFLVNNSCYHFQGYLFGKPMPIDEFESLLKQN